MPRAERPAKRAKQAPDRDALMRSIGMEIVRFQDASNAFDDAAGAVLALERHELSALSALLYGGAMPAEALGAIMGLGPTQTRNAIDRLALEGYVRRGDASVSLTDHARRWIETIWGPLADEGMQLLGSEPVEALTVMARFMASVRPIHEAHAARVRALAGPSPVARGGLSPAALRRVQLFVEANLAEPLTLADLAARAQLSTYHFARAFKLSAAQTPRAYVEARRVEHARVLLRSTTLSLARVARECGLGTQSRFTTTFRRATGYTPAVFRKGVSFD